jgi:hypothetical protein
MQTSSDPGKPNGDCSNKSATALDVHAICVSLRELADMAYRQKRMTFFGHLTDAAALLEQAYPAKEQAEEPKGKTDHAS